MAIDIYYGDGQTAIDEDKKMDLIPFWVTNNEQLNRLEQENINQAISVVGLILLFFNAKASQNKDNEKALDVERKWKKGNPIKLSKSSTPVKRRRKIPKANKANRS